jgi:hypothetical protein
MHATWKIGLFAGWLLALTATLRQAASYTRGETQFPRGRRSLHSLPFLAPFIRGRRSLRRLVSIPGHPTRELHITAWHSMHAALWPFGQATPQSLSKFIDRQSPFTIRCFCLPAAILCRARSQSASCKRMASTGRNAVQMMRKVQVPSRGCMHGTSAAGLHGQGAQSDVHHPGLMHGSYLRW